MADRKIDAKIVVARESVSIAEKKQHVRNAEVSQFVRMDVKKLPAKSVEVRIYVRMARERRFAKNVAARPSIIKTGEKQKLNWLSPPALTTRIETHAQGVFCKACTP